MSRTIQYAYGHGGHVGGHLRDPFCDYVDSGELPEETSHNGRDLTIRGLAGLLWNCTDIMPGWACSKLGLPQGSTYAQGARLVRGRLAGQS